MCSIHANTAIFFSVVIWRIIIKLIYILRIWIVWLYTFFLSFLVFLEGCIFTFISLSSFALLFFFRRWQTSRKFGWPVGGGKYVRYGFHSGFAIFEGFRTEEVCFNFKLFETDRCYGLFISLLNNHSQLQCGSSSGNLKEYLLQCHWNAAQLE